MSRPNLENQERVFCVADYQVKATPAYNNILLERYPKLANLGMPPFVLMTPYTATIMRIKICH